MEPEVALIKSQIETLTAWMELCGNRLMTKLDAESRQTWSVLWKQCHAERMRLQCSPLLHA
jgi:hypothetical protein